MAIRKDTVESLQLYRKILVGMAAVAVVLPCLLGLTKYWTPLAAAVLALPACFLWKYKGARGVMRFLTMVILLAAPVLLLVLVCLGKMQEEYISLLVFSQLPLPALALAVMDDRKADVVLMRIAAVVQLVAAGLLIVYIFEDGSWAKSILFAAAALALGILTLMSHPPVVFHKKTPPPQPEA